MGVNVCDGSDLRSFLYVATCDAFRYRSLVGVLGSAERRELSQGSTSVDRYHCRSLPHDSRLYYVSPNMPLRLAVATEILSSKEVGSLRTALQNVLFIQRPGTALCYHSFFESSPLHIIDESVLAYLMCLLTAEVSGAGIVLVVGLELDDQAESTIMEDDVKPLRILYGLGHSY